MRNYGTVPGELWNNSLSRVWTPPLRILLAPREQKNNNTDFLLYLCSPPSSDQGFDPVVGNDHPLSDNRTADGPHFADSAITMPARYAPLPTQRPSEHSDDELDAAFDGSDDELDYDDDNAPISESQPLNPSRSGRTSPPLSTRNHLPPIAIPGAYDFERVDYDVPPPGSPTRAMANDHGNTNGQIPSFDTDVDFAGNRRGGYRSWFSRAAANVLPSHYVRQLGLGGPSAPTAHVGGGVRNDGVFSNLAAKPERQRLQQTGAWHVMRSTHHLPVQV
jgi:hypothetical protein